MSSNFGYGYVRAIFSIVKNACCILAGASARALLKFLAPIDSKIVGSLSKKLMFDELTKKMESKSFKEIQMDINGTDVAELPNGNIMVSCYYSGAINVYDENFKLIKKVTSVNNQDFKCLINKIKAKDFKKAIENASSSMIEIRDSTQVNEKMGDQMEKSENVCFN